MRLVVAVGGNALLKRDQPMTTASQLEAIVATCDALASLSRDHQLVVTHGTGPQIGMLAQRTATDDTTTAYSFDVLDAQTEGMLGYLIERELRNKLAATTRVATLLTMTSVDAKDPALSRPTKFIGPGYPATHATYLAAENGWIMRQDGRSWRRVVPSPEPGRVLELDAARSLLDRGYVVICGGGGGVPVATTAQGDLVGIEAVVDKDRTSAVIARDLPAECLVIATDVDGVFEGWGTRDERLLRQIHPDDLKIEAFPAGSMQPKVAAAAQFARTGHGDAIIGPLDRLADLVVGAAGTTVSMTTRGVSYW